jgi:hypothetical protein
VDAPNLVREDRFCISCGYAIVGLPVDGPCPECATPVERSLRGSLLRHANQDYLKKLARGASLIRWGAVLTSVLILSMVAMFGAAFTGLFTGPGGGTAGVMVILGLGFLGLCLAAAICSVIGWWSFTTRDPGLPSTDRSESIRQRVRWYFIAWLTLILVRIAMSPMRSFAGMMATAMNGWMDAIVSLASAVLMLLWFVAAMRYVRTIGDRIPDPSIRSRGKWCANLAVTLAVVQIIFIVAAAIAFSGTQKTMVANQAAFTAYQAQVQAAQAAGQPPPPFPVALTTSTTSMASAAMLTGCGAIAVLFLSLALFIVYSMLTGRLRQQCLLAWEESQTSGEPAPALAAAIDVQRPE